MFSPEPNLAQPSTPDPGFQAQLADAAVELVEASGAIGSAIWLWDEVHEALQVVAHYRLSDDYVAYGNQVSRLDIAKERAPVYKVCALGEPLGFEQPFSDEKLTYFSAGYQESPVRYIYALPMIHDGEAIGALALYYDRNLAPTELQVLWLRAVVRRLCDAVARQQQETRLRTQILELEQSNTFLQTMVTSLEREDGLKRQLLGQVNHDLRTPLTAIKGFAELMELEIGDAMTPSLRASIDSIQRNVDRLIRMGNGLLDAVRLEEDAFALMRQPTDLVALIQSVVTDLRPLAKAKSQALEVDARGGCDLDLDPQRLEQVMFNLVGNAIKYTPQGGRILARVLERGEVVRVEVIDDGDGIPLEQQSRLFEKFHRLNGREAGPRHGSGLGLWIVKNIVEAHAGRVGVESTPGTGSAFWFELPGSKSR